MKKLRFLTLLGAFFCSFFNAQAMRSVLFADSCVHPETKMKVSDLQTGQVVEIPAQELASNFERYLLFYSELGDEKSALKQMETVHWAPFESQMNGKLVIVHFVNNHSLKLTPNHPVATFERKMVRAEHLNVGDKVLDEAGNGVEIQSISQEDYIGKVYNFGVLSGRSSELALFAEGMAVGDFVEQYALENPELKAN